MQENKARQQTSQKWSKEQRTRVLSGHVRPPEALLRPHGRRLVQGSLGSQGSCPAPMQACISRMAFSRQGRKAKDKREDDSTEAALPGVRPWIYCCLCLWIQSTTFHGAGCLQLKGKNRHQLCDALGSKTNPALVFPFIEILSVLDALLVPFLYQGWGTCFLPKTI